MGRMITGDESWIRHFDSATKQESMRWKSLQSPVKKKVNQAKSMNKVMLILFLKAWGAVYAPRHTTINALYCCKILRILKRRMKKKRPDLQKIWLLHHNTKPHNASIVQDRSLPIFLQTFPILFQNFHVIRKIEVHTHPTYSLNLAPCDFWVFGALKQELRNRHFESDVVLVTAANRFSQDLPPEEFHKTIMLSWIADDGGHFEKGYCR